LALEAAVGVVLICLSIIHVVYGERRQVAVLKSVSDNPVLIGSFRTMSLQGGLLLLALGVVYMLGSAGMVTLGGVPSYFPLGVVLINVLSLLIVALTKHRELLKETVPQLVIFGAVIVLQVLIAVRG